MMAHVQGTGSLAYPEQDPADLRAGAVREQFDAIHRALGTYSLIYSRYASRQTDFKTVCDARARLDRVLAFAQATVLDALETAEVTVIHDRREGA